MDAHEAGVDEGFSDIERMLMDQYELVGPDKAGPAPAAPAGPSGLNPRSAAEEADAAAQDVTSLDSPDFSVDAWMQSRKSQGLDILMHQLRALRTDIVKFKNNTQTLVHDNYSRFIAAADIIRTMHAEFDGMVLETDSLRQQTDAATSESEQMNGRLKVSRGGLAKLSELQKLLLHLQAVRRLPSELRELVVRRDYGSAVLLYSKSQALLQSMGHVALLRPVKQELTPIIEGVKTQMLQLLGNVGAETPAMAATVQMLRMLGVSAGDMQKVFLDGHQRQISAIIVQCCEAVKAAEARRTGAPRGGPADPPGPSSGAVPYQVVMVEEAKTLAGSVLSSLSQTAQMYISLFGAPASGCHDAPLTSFLSCALGACIHTLKHVCARYHSDAAMAAALYARPPPGAGGAGRPGLEELVAREHVAAADVFEGDFGVAGLLALLQDIQTAVADHEAAINSAHLLPAVKEFAAGAVRHLLGCAMVAVEQSAVNATAGIVSLLSNQTGASPSQGKLAGSCVDLAVLLAASGVDAVTRAFSAALACPFLFPDDWAVADLVQAQLQRFFLSLVSKLELLASLPKPGRTTHTICSDSKLGFSVGSDHEMLNPLFPTSPRHRPRSERGDVRAPSGTGASAADELADWMPLEAAADMAAEPAPCAAEVQVDAAPDTRPAGALVAAAIAKKLETGTVAQVVEHIAARLASPDARYQHSMQEAPPFVAKAVQARLQQAQRQLLQYFVQLHARPLTNLVSGAVSEAAAASPPPPTVRPYCTDLCDQLALVTEQAMQLLPMGHALPDALAPAANRRRSTVDSMRAAESGSVVPAVFHERGKLQLTSVEATAASVVLALCRHVLLSLVESIRMEVLSVAQAELLSAELRFMRGQLDSEVLRPFFHDAFAACEARTVEQ